MEDGAKNRGSNLSILCENDGDSNGPANSTLVFDYGSGIGQSTKIFWSSWDRFTAKAPDTIGDGQWKLRRLGATNNISDNNAELVLFRNNYSGNNAVNYSIRTSTATVNHFDQSGTVNDLNKPQFDDTWRRTDQFIDTGTDGAYNGSIQIVGHFPDFSAIPALYSMEEFDATAVWPDAENVYGSGSERFRYFLHQNFFGNGAGTYPMSSYGAEVRHNDIFIQIGSYKRVELCNSTSLATATHREILYPTAWSDTSVTAKVRQGGFSSGTYYAHVVDEDGSSLGYQEVTI